MSRAVAAGRSLAAAASHRIENRGRTAAKAKAKTKTLKQTEDVSMAEACLGRPVQTTNGCVPVTPVV